MVHLTGVSKWYQDQARILDHINLTLKKGDFLYVIGGTGAGKSSLLRILATEDAPSSGEISLFGFSIKTCGSTTLTAIRRSVSYVPQTVRLISDLTVQDNVALSLSLAGTRVLSAQAREKIADLLTKIGLIDKRHRLAGELSGGEAQRVAIARALVREPELLIADEPTGSQDPNFTWLLMDLILKANRSGTSVVLATHDREIVRRVRKRCAVLSAGRLQLEEALCTY